MSANPNALARLIIIGQDPGPGRDGTTPLAWVPAGCAGHRLQEMSGLTRYEYRSVARVNLCATQADDPGAAGRRERAQTVERFLPGRIAVLLGRRVCEAFGISKIRPWFSAVKMRPDRLGPHLTLVPHPHPSGRCRGWNDPGVVETARRFWALVTSTVYDPLLSDGEWGTTENYPVVCQATSRISDLPSKTSLDHWRCRVATHYPRCPSCGEPVVGGEAPTGEHWSCFSASGVGAGAG